MYDSVLVSGRVEAAICMVCWNPGDASFPTKVEDVEHPGEAIFTSWMDGRVKRRLLCQVLVPSKKGLHLKVTCKKNECTFLVYRLPKGV